MPKQPELVWLDNLTPKSTQFDDTYYSRQNGLAETRHVFIDGNDLPRRWADDTCPVIGELGFGTGLNFLATWLAWTEHRQQKTALKVSHYASPENGRTQQLPGKILDEDSQNGLTFLSVEKFPMDRMSLLTALSPWEILHPLANQLAAQWQPDKPGWQILTFDHVRLLLFIGDASQAVSSMPLSIDAWYLDGFNPKTNPDLWSSALMDAVHHASNPDATLASYTAAGWVRRNLQAAGFAIEKRKGFGHKRDMITGTKIDKSNQPASIPSIPDQ